MESDEISFKQIGIPIWNFDYSIIKDKSIRDKYIEFAEFSKQKLFHLFKMVFNFDLSDRFDFKYQVPEGSLCFMTKIASEEYKYVDKQTGKVIHILINFSCNRKCRDILTSNRIYGYRLKAYQYYTPDIKDCELELVYELQKNRENGFGYDRLDNINNGDIEKYLFENLFKNSQVNE